MQETLEKSPGVYVRDQESHHAPHELDMLWGNAKHLYKEERSPILYFILGLVTGIILSGAAFYLFLTKPPFLTPEASNTPAIQQNGTTQTQPDQGILPKISLPGFSPAPQQQSAQPAQTSSSSNDMGHSRTYTVKSGDTLGKIAQEFYGDSSPAMVDKIVRANNMKNPHALQLDQKLVIPPRNY